ncbi:MAG: phospholipase [Saprospiraceae bacterium]|nr:MAG: phospholipase [Saprospiraceae bacterium]
MSQAHKITIPKTAHYYTIGTPAKTTRRFWMVCHGYGQLARTFIRRFRGLDDGETFVVAPEGLSHFYWEGYTGEPVASWMTKEHRLDEIADYANYLQTLYDHYLPQLAEDVQIILLGFSQGTATQCRWVMRNFPHFDHLVLWAGQLPDDLDYTAHTDFFSKKKLYFVYGTADPFLTEERVTRQQNFAEEQHLLFDVMVFDGRHEVEKKALQMLNARILAGG